MTGCPHRVTTTISLPGGCSSTTCDACGAVLGPWPDRPPRARIITDEFGQDSDDAP